MDWFLDDGLLKKTEKVSTRPVEHCPTNMCRHCRRIVERQWQLGRAEQSSSNAALRRAEGAELDCESADRAIIKVTAMRVVLGHCPRDQVRDSTHMREAQLLEGAIDRIVRHRESELLIQPHDEIAR